MFPVKVYLNKIINKNAYNSAHFKKYILILKKYSNLLPKKKWISHLNIQNATNIRDMLSLIKDKNGNLHIKELDNNPKNSQNVGQSIQI